MKAIIATTNGIILEGTTDFLGSATIALNVPTLSAHKATKLYELDAHMTQYSDHWRVQIAKSNIEEFRLFDEQDTKEE